MVLGLLETQGSQEAHLFHLAPGGLEVPLPPESPFVHESHLVLQLPWGLEGSNSCSNWQVLLHTAFSPLVPGNPMSPFSPISPFSPGGPIAPRTPGGPGSPCLPRGPCSPCKGGESSFKPALLWCKNKLAEPNLISFHSLRREREKTTVTSSRSTAGEYIATCYTIGLSQSQSCIKGVHHVTMVTVKYTPLSRWVPLHQ